MTFAILSGIDPMIVTLDTSILVRALPDSRGPAKRLLDIITANPKITLALSDYIVNEVGKVLSSPSVASALALDAPGLATYLRFLRTESRISVPAHGLPVVLSDPHDDPILYTAISARANVLCTRDRHFFDPHVISVCQRYDLAIMDDLQLLARLNQ